MAWMKRLWHVAVAAASLGLFSSVAAHGGEEHHDDADDAALPAIAQFCLDGWDRQGPRFCMAASMYHNHSTSAHDMLVSVEVTRPADAALASAGWLAIGSGAVMSGSLMFVVYGDPLTGQGPFVSARGVEIGNGHTPPDVLSRDDPSLNHGVLVQQLGAGEWRAGANGTHVGVVRFACYACTAWSGHAVDAEATSQPLIWAFNGLEDMAPYAWDQPLHKHVGVSGWGNFYANLQAASTHHAAGPPAVVPGHDRINAAATHITVKPPSFFQRLRARPAAHAHGFVMLLAFLALFPLGVVGIRSGLDRAFKYHWTIQAGAMCFATVGAALGIYMSRGNLLGSAHQKVGLAVFALLFAQAASGWWHHVRFVRIRRRTWVSYAHMGLGWGILLGGWANAVTGAMLFGLGRPGLLVLVGLVATELMALVAVVYVARRKSRQDRAKATAKATDWRDGENEEYFALDDADSEDDDEEDTSSRKSDEKLRPAKYHK
ncbi:Carbohydrate-binding domain family 9-like protein [Cordyceps fumosorosea ARSEF 2679]|uniref:Carbohydrate-binding domain family 9-like protein n=1 Tax=Cordyceps fumosorosea (strain ARSEF 2679) TaxID=1081104 RepID=A0A168E7K2_CORFA|nr:Carbohydrate-binding domain family 9-like protein [Cordyceps fumosorosea ARSEF 2679]OAA73468.1 Carbohydrate-binding domain family 9-like protein [Cordyceps fumosorosea ARSEF 2679]